MLGGVLKKVLLVLLVVVITIGPLTIFAGQPQGSVAVPKAV